MAPYVNLKTPNWNKCSVTKDLHVLLLVLASADCHGQFAVVGNWALRAARLLNVQGHTLHVCCAQVAHTQLPNHELEGLTWTGLSLPHTCTCSPHCMPCGHTRTCPDGSAMSLSFGAHAGHQQTAFSPTQREVTGGVTSNSSSVSLQSCVELQHIGNTLKTVHLKETWSTLVSCLPLFWV